MGGLDVIGKNVAVGHFVRIRSSGVCRARSRGYQRKKAVWRREEEGQVSFMNGACKCQLPKQREAKCVRSGYRSGAVGKKRPEEGIRNVNDLRKRAGRIRASNPN